MRDAAKERRSSEKARTGIVIGGHPVSYGFEYAYGLDHKERERVVGYEVDDVAMQNVRRIFETVGFRCGRAHDQEHFG